MLKRDCLALVGRGGGRVVFRHLPRPDDALQQLDIIHRSYLPALARS